MLPPLFMIWQILHLTFDSQGRLYLKHFVGTWDSTALLCYSNIPLLHLFGRMVDKLSFDITDIVWLIIFLSSWMCIVCNSKVYDKVFTKRKLEVVKKKVCHLIMKTRRLKKLNLCKFIWAIERGLLSIFWKSHFFKLKC